VHFSRRGPARLAGWTLFALAALSAFRGLAEPSVVPPDPPGGISADEEPSPGGLILDDAPEPLPPERRRTEADEDRAEALARFSAGRAMQRKQEFAPALRHYQRALQHDPESETVARAVVRLAIQLDREDEAVRVAKKMESPEALGALDWMKLGVSLIKKGNWEQAARMYEKALAARSDVRQTLGDVALRLELGRIQYLLEEYEKAAHNFARVREALKNPQEFGLDDDARRELVGDPGSTHILMGNAFLNCDRIDEAVAAFEESHREAPNKGLLGYNLARAEARSGQPANALAKLQAYFQEHLASEGVAPYEFLAQVLKDLGKGDELIGRLETLRAEDGENAPLGYFLAETYRKSEQLDKAESLYRSLVEKTPAVTGYRALVAIYRQTDRPDPLLDVLGDAAAKGITPDALGEEARPPINEDADLVDALIEVARKRHKEAPDQFGPGHRLAAALVSLDAGRFEEAKEFFDLSLQDNPDRASETLLAWGLGLLDQEQYAAAAEVFQRGIDQKLLPDDNSALYYYLSGALELDGRTEEALAAARNAVEIDPDSPRFASRVAWILYRNDRHEQAAEAYGQLVEKFDSDFSSAMVRQVMRESRLVLSNLAVLAGDHPQAERWLEEVLDEFPDDVGALNDLGYLWADQNVRLQRAHRMIRQALEGDPENGAYRDSLGWVLYRLGRLDEALVELEKAAAQDQEEPEILDHLGDAYRALNQPEKAKDAWQRAVGAYEEKKRPEKAKTVQEKLDNHP